MQTVADFGSTVADMGIGEDGAGPYSSLYVTLGILIGVMLLVVMLLLFITANMVNLVRVREGKEAFSLKGTFNYTLQLMKNPFIAVVGNFLVLIVALVIAVPQLRSVGFQQNYQPEQPIKFSHALHAGQYEIDCQYCHTGASKGKNAWIPSVNVCMNCHKGIQQGPKHGEKEIAKVRAAWENDTPIEWVRIHNLPDLAYFNHQQHVVVGGLECEECHGPVKEMEEVYQFSPLSMGWCINCHRETEVNADLYKKLGREDVKVAEDIGATNCARCHY